MGISITRQVFWRLEREARRALRYAGYELVRGGANRISDQPAWVRDIIAQVQPFTITTPERITALCNAVEYVSKCGIPGNIVECGVWRGGSMMAAALSLMHLGDTSRILMLFDTFDGMTPPSDLDRDSNTRFSATELLAVSPRTSRNWAVSPIQEVRGNLAKTAYPTQNIDLVKGPVEETIPGFAPDRIAILRLDTDWHASTKHELIHLYPRLASGGVLIIDDYGDWEGARKAVDDYIDEQGLKVLLVRIDRAARIAVKP